MSAEREKAGNKDVKAGNYPATVRARNMEKLINEQRNRIELLEKELRSQQDASHAGIDKHKDLSQERKWAERALRFTQFAVDKAGDEVFWIARDGRFHYVNEAACRALGYNRDEFLQLTVYDIDPLETPQNWPPKWKSNGGSATFESIHRTRDGRTYPVEVVVNYISYDNMEFQCAFARDITERKRADEALRFTQFSVDRAGEEIYWIAEDGRFHQVNAAACHVLGYTRDELLNLKVYDIDPRVTEENWPKFWERTNALGISTFETVHCTKAGKNYPVEVTSNNLQYNQKEYHCAFARDITERKQAEEALQESEDKFKTIFNRAALGMAISNSTGVIIDCNSAYQEILGYSKEELLAKNFLDLTHVDDITKNSDFQRQMNDGLIDSYQIEKRYIHKNGKIVLCKLTSSAIRNRDGSLKYNMAIVEDITERKRAEAELLRINRALKAISRCNEVVIHVRDERALLKDICNVVVENGGYRMAWIGFRADDSGKSVKPVAKTGVEDGYVEKALVTWADTERGRGPAGTALRTGKPSVVRNILDPNFRPWREDAIRMGYASVLGLPLVADDRAFGVLTIYSARQDAFDAEEIRLLQELADNMAYGITSLRSRNEQERAEKALAEAKSRAELYLDLMGHDINNMHQIALGYLELAENMSHEPVESEYLGKSIEVLQRSTQLIRNVRKLQKLSEGILPGQVVDMCKLLKDVQREFGGVPHKTVTLNMGGHDHCHVRANELLYDVFANLVSNAIKHTGNSADITVALDVIEEGGYHHCRVSVEDNGPGIPDEFKVLIFNRALKGANKAKGMGLGLYLVKSLIEGFGGRVWVEDRVPGDYAKGSRFVVMLPAAEQ